MDRQIVPTFAPLASSTTINHSLSIKLILRNFLTWKTQFQPLNNYHKLIGFIDGSIPAPLSFVPSTNHSNQSVPNPKFSY